MTVSLWTIFLIVDMALWKAAIDLGSPPVSRWVAWVPGSGIWRYAARGEK